MSKQTSHYHSHPERQKKNEVIFIRKKNFTDSYHVAYSVCFYTVIQLTFLARGKKRKISYILDMYINVYET